ERLTLWWRSVPDCGGAVRHTLQPRRVFGLGRLARIPVGFGFARGGAHLVRQGGQEPRVSPSSPYEFLLARTTLAGRQARGRIDLGTRIGRWRHLGLRHSARRPDPTDLRRGRRLPGLVPGRPTNSLCEATAGQHQTLRQEGRWLRPRRSARRISCQGYSNGLVGRCEVHRLPATRRAWKNPRGHLDPASLGRQEAVSFSSYRVQRALRSVFSRRQVARVWL